MNLMQVTLSVDLPSLGSRIREIREAKGLSPTWVAARSRYERWEPLSYRDGRSEVFTS